jgi:hypothetical protein
MFLEKIKDTCLDVFTFSLVIFWDIYTQDRASVTGLLQIASIS